MGKKIVTVVCGLILLFPIWGSINALSNFTSVDPRTQAANFMKANVSAPTTVGMVDVPRFWSPPIVPQDVIFGSNLSLADIEKTDPTHRFHFAVTGFDIKKLDLLKPTWFVMSEFEWRDEARLRPMEFSGFMHELLKEYDLKESYKNHPLLALPGRVFAPHDFLYTNPQIRIYKRID